MNIFFCDVRGTFDGNVENRSKAVDRFVNNLRNICQILNIEEMTFDFVTSEDMPTLLTFIKELEPLIKNTPIRFANQFSDREKYYQGKIEESEHKNKLAQIYYSLKGKDIKRVFFADDTLVQQKIVKRVLRTSNPQLDFVSIMPNTYQKTEDGYISEKYGIDGLNEAVETYINNLENTHTL